MSKLKVLLGVLFVLTIPGCMDPPPGKRVQPKPPMCDSIWLPPARKPLPEIDTVLYERLTNQARKGKTLKERMRADILANDLLVKSIEEITKATVEYDNALAAARMHYVEQCYPKITFKE